MGEELDKRLDENKYEMWEALIAIRFYLEQGTPCPQTIKEIIQDVLAKVEMK